MANAKKCDRCGTFYMRYRNCVPHKKTKEGLPVCGIQHDSGYINTYDLCPECFDGLIKFMKIDIEGENNE